MPTFEFSGPDGKTYEVGAPDGATQEQAFQILQGQIAGGEAPAAAPASAAFSAGRAINGLGRQVGLTARYALEGPAQALQVVTEPVRYLTDKLLPDRGGVSNLVTGQAAPPKSTPLGVQATKLADTLGLPKPETPNERVIGDATRLVAGAGGMAGAASAGARAIAGPTTQLLSEAAPAALTGGQNLLRGLAANVPAQLGSAAGAGLAGGASREAGGGPWQQAGAALLGGIAGGMAPSAAEPLIGMARRAVTPAMTPQQLDVQLSTVLQRAGTDYSQLPEAVRRSLRAELSDALRTGRELDPAAVSRLADFRAVGATPTRGMISQNPVQITREQNLAKMAANSADGELHGLPLMQNQNNQALIGRLNDLGGRTETGPLTAGRLVQDRIRGTDAALGSVEQGAWNAAKNSPGFKQPIYPDGLNAAMKSAGDDALVGYLPKQITDYMAVFQTGQQPFTAQHYANLRSMLSAELAKGGNEARAASSALRGLESVPMRPITNPGGIDLGTAPVTAGLAGALRDADGQAGSAIDAVNRARAATRAKYAYQESSPLVRTALADARTADPEKIAQSFILNGTLNDAQAVAREVGPQGIATIRDALATHIKKQAMSGASDEVGKVSQSQLNAAINKIGEEKLRLFFSPEEVAQLRSAARVASLMQAQPVGSAVNNSNSGALILGRGMDMLGSVAGRIPFGQAAVVDPLRNLNISISQRQAQNLTPGLLRAPPQSNPVSPLLLPAVAVGGGLLSAP
jgi:hypothetical protein